jgi:hypothetical protein
MTPRVHVEQGDVEGAEVGGVFRFLGLPCSQPPVGERRWRAPLPPTAWDGVLSASRFGPVCPQVGGASFDLPGPGARPGLDRRRPEPHFGIQELDGHLYVTYALQNAAKHDDVSGPGHGFIDIFTNGDLVKRLASHGTLNSPWGLALAPDGFGAFGPLSGHSPASCETSRASRSTTMTCGGCGSAPRRPGAPARCCSAPASTEGTGHGRRERRAIGCCTRDTRMDSSMPWRWRPSRWVAVR